MEAQHGAHKAEDDEHTDVHRSGEDEAGRLRAEAAKPLTVQVEADGTTFLTAVEREAAASGRLTAAGRFGRRRARAEHRDPTEHTRTVRAQVGETWGEPPRYADALTEWPARQTERHAEADPRVIDAAQQVEAARGDHNEMRRPNEQERLALLVSEHGADQARRAHLRMRLPNPHRLAHNAITQASVLRTELDELRALPVNETASLREATRTERERSR